MEFTVASPAVYYGIPPRHQHLWCLVSGGAAPLGCYIAPLGLHNFYCNPSDDYQILAILSDQEQ